MKKLTKLFTVLFVIIAMFACVSTVLADEEIPSTDETTEEAIFEEEIGKKGEELDVPVDFIEQDVPEDVILPEQPVEVITDTDGVAHIDEELVGENEEEIGEDNYGWLHLTKTVTVEENQADILLTIHPELGKEVDSVEATAYDIGLFFVKKQPGAVEVKQVIDENGCGTGEWLVVTNDVTYELHYDNVFGKYFYNALKSDVEGEYDVIYIDVDCSRIDLEGKFIQNFEGDLRLEEDDIVLAEGTENITIFDAENPENYVKNYEFAYRDSHEGLTIDNIKYYVECLDGEGAEGIEVSFKEGTNGKEVQVTGIKEGKYVVYLEGYFTEELYDKKASNADADFWERGKKGVSYYEDGDVKVVYRTTGFYPWDKKTTKDVYMLKETNSGWATFAKFNIDVVSGVTSVDGDTTDNHNEWVVAEEIDGRRGEEEFYVETKGFDGVNFYNVDAYCQETNKDGETLPAEQIHKTEEEVTLTLKVDGCEFKKGYTPKFTVYHYNNNWMNPVTEVEGAVTTFDGTNYYVTFKTDRFSKFSVAWNYKKNPTTSYEFVNTGVDGTQQQVNVAGLVTMCAFALLVALKKRVSHC